jgi:hypothetical protein
MLMIGGGIVEISIGLSLFYSEARDSGSSGHPSIDHMKTQDELEGLVAG